MTGRGHEPVRSCAACRRKGSKGEFIRIVRQEAGRVAVDDSGKQPGRGAYICANKECLKVAVKKRALARALRLTNGAGASLESVYEDLRLRIKQGNGADR